MPNWRLSELSLFQQSLLLHHIVISLSSGIIFSSFLRSVMITVVGTTINILMTVIAAYPLSRRNLRGRKLIMKIIVFTMLFSGGIIPTYLVVNALNLLDTYWSLWLPVAISAFNLILMRNFFMAVPVELSESAKIDGCNEPRILSSIFIPLSKPSIAALNPFLRGGPLECILSRPNVH